MRLPAIFELVESLEQLPNCRITVFDGGTPEPTVDLAEAAYQAAVAAQADCVVGIGGGSNLDVAKMVAVVITHGGQARDYFGFDAIPGPLVPIIAVPTTAGTGSEVSHSAVLTDVVNAMKVSTLSHWLRPTIAIVDPALTDSCPRSVTAASGIDALVHAIEAYTNRNYTQMIGVDPQARAYEGSYPLTSLLAGEAIRLVGRSLVKACEHPADMAARDDMALAAMLAGMAFSNSGVGIVHALEYPIGAATHVGHGEGNGLLLPHVMRFNLPECIPAFADIAAWLGVDSLQASATLASDADCAEWAIESVKRILGAIGIRTRLRDIGLPRESIPEMAVKAFAIKRLMDVSPRRPQQSDLEAILTAAY